MNTTINISLPLQLKAQAQDAVEAGFFTSFSDVVRSALRNELEKIELDLLEAEAWRDHKNGKTRALNTDQDIDNFFNSFTK